MIGAIVVLYNPDFDILDKGLRALIPQVNEVCIVDNSSMSHAKELSSYQKIHYLPLLENRGIAAAQNIGIKYFMEKDSYKYVLFSDQDSITEDGVVKKLYEAYIHLQNHKYKIAAVGTRAINRETNKAYPPKSKEFNKIAAKSIGYDADLTECYSVISSISLISTISLRLIGGMDESLFIDGVDHEWCWRAWHKEKLRSFIVEDALLNHHLGEGDRKLLNKEISISSSFRVYYQFRNYLWLCRRGYTPSFWKRKNLLKYGIKFFYFPITKSPRLRYLKNILRGLYDGIFHYNPKEEWPIFQQKNA